MKATIFFLLLPTTLLADPVQLMLPDSSIVTVEMNTTASKFGLAVYVARKNKGLTQHTLAELTGLSAAMISKIENGLANPTLGTVHCLCGYLNIFIEIKFEHD